ncbi:MAG: SHOCT domain-containing protein [Bacteroidetes bacterium]|nr:SHOCT domain-containing protein [Bacteroidota bacterium]
MERGYKYIKTFKWDIAKNINFVTLTKLKKIYTTNLNNTYLEANAVITFNDNSTFKTSFEINFDGAIESGELIVPAELKVKSTATNSTSVADEIVKLKKLLDDGTITKEEFEAAKKKLLQQ